MPLLAGDPRGARSCPRSRARRSRRGSGSRRPPRAIARGRSPRSRPARPRPSTPCWQPPWRERLDHRLVGVLELHVLADQRDPHLALGRVGAAHDRSSHSRQVGRRRLDPEVVEDRGRRRPRRGTRAAPCRCCRRRGPRSPPPRAGWRTARSSCGSRGRGPLSERQSSTCGWMPMRRSSLTECWVGLVFSSPAWPM